MDLMLKQIREKRGLTQPELAKILDMKLATYRTWEQGTVKITLENAYRIALVLDCTPNDLCGWPEDKVSKFSFDDNFEEELLTCYRASTIDRRDRILDTARDAAAMSKSENERVAPKSEQTGQEEMTKSA